MSTSTLRGFSFVFVFEAKWFISILFDWVICCLSHRQWNNSSLAYKKNTAVVCMSGSNGRTTADFKSKLILDDTPSLCNFQSSLSFPFLYLLESAVYLIKMQVYDQMLAGWRTVSKYSRSVTFNTIAARLGHWMSERFNCGTKEKSKFEEKLVTSYANCRLLTELHSSQSKCCCRCEIVIFMLRNTNPSH